MTSGPTKRTCNAASATLLVSAVWLGLAAPSAQAARRLPIGNTGDNAHAAAVPRQQPLRRARLEPGSAYMYAPHSGHRPDPAR